MLRKQGIKESVFDRPGEVFHCFDRKLADHIRPSSTRDLELEIRLTERITRSFLQGVL